MTTFVVYALVGKIIIFLLQKFPKHKLPIIGKLFREGKFLEELFSCSLCLGFWIYSGLAYILDVNLIGGFFITGAVTTFAVWVFSEGWHSLFSEYKLE
jgi:amino acid transporter